MHMPHKSHLLETTLRKVGVSKNRGKTPKSSILIRVFRYKPSILGYPYFWKHPYIHIYIPFYIRLFFLCGRHPVFQRGIQSGVLLVISLLESCNALPHEFIYNINIFSRTGEDASPVSNLLFVGSANLPWNFDHFEFQSTKVCWWCFSSTPSLHHLGCIETCK